MIKKRRDRDKCVYTGLSEDPDSLREKKVSEDLCVSTVT
jgi:hypothetical protein